MLLHFHTNSLSSSNSSLTMAIPITMASLNSLSFFPSSFIPSKPNLIFTFSLSLSSAVTSTHLTAVSNAAVTATGSARIFRLITMSFFPESSPSDRRRAGILLHPTSLPGPHGIGDLEDEAFQFIDWLHSALFGRFYLWFLLVERLLKKARHIPARSIATSMVHLLPLVYLVKA